MLAIGTRVDVRERFCGRWSTGFEVVESGRGAYRVCRASDRSELPASFVAAEIRRTR
jgi:hypothetical protein